MPNQTMRNITDLFECYNLISHIRKRLNLDNSMPTEISAVVIHSRSISSLYRKLTEFSNSNAKLNLKLQMAPVNIQKMSLATNKILSKNSEESSEILSNTQKLAFVEFSDKIIEGILYCAGYLATYYETVVKDPSYEDKENFIKEAKSIYYTVSEFEEKLAKENAHLGDDFQLPEVSMKDIKDSNFEEDSEIILGVVKKDKSISTDPLE